MRIRVFISKIFFDNKAMSLLIYQTYYNDCVVRSLIQGYIKKFDVPTVVHNREKPLYSRIFILIHLCLTLILIDFFQVILSFHVMKQYESHSPRRLNITKKR